MAKKFLNLIEQISAKMNSGFQTGGLVKLASNYKSKEGYKNQNKEQQKYIDDYFDSDSNYLIKNVSTEYPTDAPNNSDNRGNFFYITVARELANGLSDTQGQVTVTSDMLEPIDLGINRHPVPGSQKYDNKVQIDPVEAEENEEQQQTMTQQGDSLKKTEMSNPTQNTKIPSSPATKSPAVNENYTSQYMPING
tara:strand:- start:32722 stop:33303 length:582 start_codon:yes stop_codon:yes gene_type:complete